MNIYNAILMAADYIEATPKEFNFFNCTVPSGLNCGSPGCALGWISFFHGGEAVKSYRILPKALDVGSGTKFYDRMDELVGKEWQEDHRICAKALRLYASKYHAPIKPNRSDSELIADLVRKITSEPIPEEA